MVDDCFLYGITKEGKTQFYELSKVFLRILDAVSLNRQSKSSKQRYTQKNLLLKTFIFEVQCVCYQVPSLHSGICIYKIKRGSCKGFA